MDFLEENIILFIDSVGGSVLQMIRLSEHPPESWAMTKLGVLMPPGSPGHCYATGLDSNNGIGGYIQ